MLKKYIKHLAKSVAQGVPSLPGGRFFYQQLLEASFGQQESVKHSQVSMNFTVPNELCRYRVATFSTKEPETLEWIDSFSSGSAFWDVGANVGLYSVYAAKRCSAKVYAFEPSVFNLELLARNIHLNNLQKQVAIVPIALSESVGTSQFRMTTSAWGGALSTFKESYGQDGRPLQSVFEYQICSISMDAAIERLELPPPDHLKIDVDGIEHLILRGGTKALANVKSVLVEINDEFLEQAEESSRHLLRAGLRLYRKCDLNAGNQFNQWWAR